MSKFTDNSSISSYAGTAMAWAVGAGIVTGVTTTEVDPGGRATRAQSVVMLRRFTKLK